MESELHLFRLDDGGCHHVIAASSIGVAIQKGIDTYAVVDDDPDELTVQRINNDSFFTVTFIDDDPSDCTLPEGATIDASGEYAKVTAQAAAWAKLAGDGGYVSGSEC